MDRLTLHRLFASASCVSLVLLGCGAPPAEPLVSSPPAGSAPREPTPIRTASAPASPSAPAPSSAPAPPRRTPPDAAAVYARLERDLTACYQQGRKSTPEMLDGRVTLNASIGASGTPACVIPSDSTGLTQDVEDCMSSRFGALRLEEGPPWSVSIPVVIRAGTVKLGERKPDTMSIESVETIRMPDAFEVLESLEPALHACLRGAEKGSGPRSMLVAARIGPDGRAQCALTTSSGVLPAGIGDCAAGVLRAAKFPAPKRGSGLVLVPLIVLGTK